MSQSPADDLQFDRSTTPHVRFQGSEYYWKLRDGGVDVLNARGERLDPVAARVILALGGDEPTWYSFAHAIEDVSAGFPNLGEAEVMEVVRAVTQSSSARAAIARSTNDVAVMRALGSLGVVQIGQNPKCDEPSWTLLLHHRDPNVTESAYESNDTLPSTLAGCPDVATQVRVARNPECPPEVLETLSYGDKRVLPAVGENPHATEEVLKRLAVDSDWAVRRAVAANASCPPSFMHWFLRDRIAQVRVATVTNPAVPWRKHARRILADPTPAVHAAAATRPELLSRELEVLERSARRDPVNQYRLVCKRIEVHPSCKRFLQVRMKKNLARIDARLAKTNATTKNVRVRFLFTRPSMRVVVSTMALLTMFVVATLAVTSGFVAASQSDWSAALALWVFGALVTFALIWTIRRRGLRASLGLTPTGTSVRADLRTWLLISILALGVIGVSHWSGVGLIGLLAVLVGAIVFNGYRSSRTKKPKLGR